MCEVCETARGILARWVGKQGHESCWYYPDVFRELCAALGVEAHPPRLPPRAEFKRGCERYEGEVYADQGHLGDAFIRDPDAPCSDFESRPRRLGDATDCEGDGHYLCKECPHLKEQTDE